MNGWGYREGEWREIVGLAAFWFACIFIPVVILLVWAR